jgi:hypothetical protein
MANTLSPSVAVTQTTNGTIINVNDNTGEYSADNTDGWGDQNDDYTDVTAATITVRKYTTASTYTDYDAINIYVDPTSPNVGDGFAKPFTSLEDLEWEIGADDLQESGTSPYTSGQIFPDGVYRIIYSITAPNENGGSALTYTTTFLLNYNVKSDVFETFRALTDNYEADICNDCDIRVAEKQWTFLEALEKASICGNITNIINTLDYLERVIAENSTYGCSCT